MACGGEREMIEAFEGENFEELHHSGYAVFIVNIEPVGNKGTFDFEIRKGAREDVGNLRTIFVEKLGFEWINSLASCHQNLTVGHWDHRKKKRQEISGKTQPETPKEPKDCCLRCHIQSLDQSHSNCFVLAISSHGREVTETEIIFSDGESIFLTEIFDALSDKQCPSLIGKPRIIILQACRSSFEDQEIVEKMQDHGVSINVVMDSDQEKKVAGARNKVAKFDMPRSTEIYPDFTFQQTAVNKMQTNFILVYPCVSGQRSQRNETDGSWLIYGLKQIVSGHFEENKPVNFLHLITLVSGYIAREKETLVFEHEKESRRPKMDLNGDMVINEKKSGIKNAVISHHRLVKPLIFYPKVKDEKINIDIPSLFGKKKKKKNEK